MKRVYYFDGIDVWPLKMDFFSTTIYVGISGRIMAQPLLGGWHLFGNGEVRYHFNK